MYLDGLDRIDQQIIDLLTHHARMSYVEIGQKVGLSRVAVKTRIQSMEEKGIIEEYTTIINPQKITNSISFYFEMELAHSLFQQAVDTLKAQDIVTQIYHVSGKNKLHVHAVAASHEEMEVFLQQVVYPMPGVLALNCNVILSRIKDVKGLRL